MAKAVYQKNQRVWVETVGCWAMIERVVPIWAKGFNEPVRVTYDVGLGRDFRAEELRPEEDAAPSENPAAGWRVLRARNKWQQPAECGHHPMPGTYPVVVTDSQDWGGWRVPGAEYDRDPRRIEIQSRMIVSAPALMRLARDLAALVAEAPEDTPAAVRELADRGEEIIKKIKGSETRPANSTDASSEPEADSAAA